ncbi:MAG: chorismate lyase [Gammaproteobacteria bacterium]|nr:chorismate lyase [Gammaproteobacteria bacterium]MCK5262200.1 chorismate lyase [Gammaproteobacteria bacterium]
MSSSSITQRWYKRRQLFTKRLPPVVRSWLFDASSLTARLIRYSSGNFHVELLSQEIRRPTWDEAKVLEIASNQFALIRQVRLCCGKKSVVYARTVIPLSTLKGAERSYANLGNRPLGAMLFADHSMRRDEVMVTQLLPENPLYKRTGAQDEIIWGRRSVFHVGDKPLLVSEYYLPELFRS